MAKRTAHKSYDQMNAEELANATAKYDRPWKGRGLPGKPLTAADRVKHRRAGLGGRPRIGQGAKIVPVSIERGLLKAVNDFAKRHNLKRSQMVAQGLRLVMQRRAG